MFRHAVRHRLRQTPKPGSHAALASFRSLSVSASSQRPRAYDKIRTEAERDDGNGNDGRGGLEEEAQDAQDRGQLDTKPTRHLGALGNKAAGKIKLAKSNKQDKGASHTDLDDQGTGSSRIASLPSDFGDKFLTSSPPRAPPAPGDDSGSGTDSLTFYEQQLKNQLLASFLPANQQALADPTLALVCPIEGGEYIVRQTIKKAASLVNADVVRIEAIECLGLRQYGGLGQGKSTVHHPLITVY